MNESFYEPQQKSKTQEDYIFECLKNITVCLYHEKAELIRKTIESNNEKEIFANGPEFRDREYLGAFKLKAIKKIIRRCAFMRDDQILMIYQLTKILTSSPETMDSYQDFDKLGLFSLGNDLNNQTDDGPFYEGDINLSLNSNSNADKKLEHLNDSNWGMDEKGDFLISNFLEVNKKYIPQAFKEQMKKRKICKRKRMELLSPKTALLSQGLSDKTTTASLERNNFPDQSIFSNEQALKNFIMSADLGVEKECIPHFLLKGGVNLLNPFFLNELDLTKFFARGGKLENLFLLNAARNFHKFNANRNKSDYNLSNTSLGGLFEKKKNASHDRQNHQVNNPSVNSGLSSDGNLKRLKKRNTSGSEADDLESEKTRSKNDLHEAYLRRNDDHNYLLENEDNTFINILKNYNKNKINRNFNQGNNQENADFDYNTKSTNSPVNAKNDTIIRSRADARKTTENKSDFGLISKENANLAPLNVNNKIKNAHMNQNNIQNQRLNKAEKAQNPPEISNTSDEDVNSYENEELKKFNTWNNPKNTVIQGSSGAARNRNNLDDLSLEKDLGFYNNNNVISNSNSREKNMFLEPRKSNKHLVQSQTDSTKANLNMKKTDKRSEAEFSNENNYADKNKKIYEFFKNNKNNNNSNSNSNSNNIYGLNEKPQNLVSKRSSNDSTHKTRDLSNCNTPSVLLHEQANVDFNSKNEEEISDIESHFSLDSQFKTNNKRVPRKPQKSIQNKQNNKNNTNYYDFNEQQIENSFMHAEFPKSNIHNSKESNYLNYSFPTEENDDHIFNFFNQQDNSFNSGHSSEFYSNSNKYTNPVKPANPPFSNAKGSMPFGNKNTNEVESDRDHFIGDNFVKKFNTSDAVKPPKILLELNEANNVTNTDPMLIVTAEIDDKKNLMGNIFASYQGGNLRSNCSASNESNELNANRNNIPNDNSNTNFTLNTFNPRQSVNNNFITNNNNNNLKTFNSGSSLGINDNSLFRPSSQYQPNKAYEENEYLMNDFMQPNTNNFKPSSVNTFNNNTHNNVINTNMSTRKKPSQKNQFFFPSEINIKNFNSNQK